MLGSPFFNGHTALSRFSDDPAPLSFRITAGRRQEHFFLVRRMSPSAQKGDIAARFQPRHPWAGGSLPPSDRDILSHLISKDDIARVLRPMRQLQAGER